MWLEKNVCCQKKQPRNKPGVRFYSAAPEFFLSHLLLPPVLTSVSALRTRWDTNRIRELLLCKTTWLKAESCICYGASPHLGLMQSGPMCSHCFPLLGCVWLYLWHPILLLGTPFSLSLQTHTAWLWKLGRPSLSFTTCFQVLGALVST